MIDDLQPNPWRRFCAVVRRHPDLALAAGLFGLFVACVSNPTSLPVIPRAIVTVVAESRVAASSDDAEQYTTGAVTRSSTKLELVDASTQPNQTVGLRFSGLTIPRAAVITNAYVQFTARETSSDATTLSLQGQATDDAPAFSSTALNISSRDRTSAEVAWAPTAWTAGEAGIGQRTPDLATIVQEIADRPGWQSGNAVAFIITGSGKRVAWSWDGDHDAAALLHVEYLSEDSPPQIDSFGVAPGSSPENQPVSFAWSVSDPQGQLVACTLDVDSDGTTEFMFPDCRATTSQAHAYVTAGNYTATLTATDSDGASVTASASVAITTSVTVAAAGDISCDPDSTKFNGGAGTDTYCHMKATSDLILAMNPDAVLALGDVQYEEATLSQFMASYDLFWGRFRSVTHPVVGNHEYLTPGAAGYYDYFGAAAGDPSKGYYSFDLGNWHVVSLNSSCSKAGGCRAGSPQERWLRADLAANPAACTLAIWHIPRYSSGALGSKTTYADWWQALQDHAADLVLVGHDHNYERFALQDAYGNADPNGLREFVVGTGGKNHTSIYSVQPNSEVRHSGTYGVLKLVLNPTGYDWDFVPEPGGTFTDTGSASCR